MNSSEGLKSKDIQAIDKTVKPRVMPKNKQETPLISLDTFSIDNIIFNNQGIDTITQIAHYKTLSNILTKEGLELQKDTSNLPINPYLKSITNQLKYDTKKRYKQDNFKPVIEYVKIAKGKGLSTFMIVVRNTPLLLDYATTNKKAKDTFCHIIFSGLHQPTKHISNEAIKFISKMLKRKAFKLHSIDLAIDYLDKKEINYKRKNLFKTDLKRLNNDSSISKGNSLYCNSVNDKNADKILLYDKFKKQSIYQKQPLSNSLKYWKRLEIEIHPTSKSNFIEFINSNDFYSDSLMICKQIASDLKVSGFENRYLEYQLNSIIDNRSMNNKTSKIQFNSKESLDKFQHSGINRYIIL